MVPSVFNLELYEAVRFINSITYFAHRFTASPPGIPLP